MKIFQIGVDDSNPDYLNGKIEIANQIALVIGFMVALPFVFISLIFFPPLTFLPVIAIPVALSTIAFNYFRLYTFARIVISLVPICLAAIYQSYLSSAGEGVTAGLAMTMLSFSMVIFVLFDLREKVLLITMSIIMLAIMLSIDNLNEALEMELNTQIMVTGALSKMVVVISTVCGAGVILIMAFQNRASENKALKSVEESRISQQNMERKEQELKDNLLKLEKAQLEEKQRQWRNEGLTLGTNIIRNNSDFQKLYDELLSFIVKYVKATHAGLFLVNDDDAGDVHLNLAAAYAYDRKKYLTKRVEIGQGLVGQTYLEKDVVYLKEIPANYLEITSGLGAAMPTVLLIVPLKIEGHVHGLIELASFHEFEEHVVEYLETLGENIASSVQSLRSSAKTQELLVTSQQQAEEMRAQEEEMRQNMEELSATQEEMSRKEMEYVRRIQELEERLN